MSKCPGPEKRERGGEEDILMEGKEKEKKNQINPFASISKYEYLAFSVRISLYRVE
jgi:hypothetical protein